VDGLVIRESKFHKTRLLPLHATTRNALHKYLVARQEVCVANRALFISVADNSLPYETVRAVFLQLLDRTGLRGAHAGRDPRIRDLRHTFAVRSLEQCGLDRIAVTQHIVALSTYPWPRARARQLLVLAGNACADGPDRRRR
jgi:site-specific recombinase XerD